MARGFAVSHSGDVRRGRWRRASSTAGCRGGFARSGAGVAHVPRARSSLQWDGRDPCARAGHRPALCVFGISAHSGRGRQRCGRHHPQQRISAVGGCFVTWATAEADRTPKGSPRQPYALDHRCRRDGRGRDGDIYSVTGNDVIKKVRSRFGHAPTATARTRSLAPCTRTQRGRSALQLRSGTARSHAGSTCVPTRFVG
jgi:hypothetical protein